MCVLRAVGEGAKRVARRVSPGSGCWWAMGGVEASLPHVACTDSHTLTTPARLQSRGRTGVQ